MANPDPARFDVYMVEIDFRRRGRQLARFRRLRGIRNPCPNAVPPPFQSLQPAPSKDHLFLVIASSPLLTVLYAAAASEDIQETLSHAYELPFPTRGRRQFRCSIAESRFSARRVAPYTSCNGKTARPVHQRACSPRPVVGIPPIDQVRRCPLPNKEEGGIRGTSPDLFRALDGGGTWPLAVRIFPRGSTRDCFFQNNLLQKGPSFQRGRPSAVEFLGNIVLPPLLTRSSSSIRGVFRPSVCRLSDCLWVAEYKPI